MSISELRGTHKSKSYSAIRAYLGMKYSLVGIKFLTEENYFSEFVENNRPGGRKWYCQMVREAACGKVFAATIENMACPNSELALGMRKPKYTGIPTMIKDEIKALIIGPVDDCDVVLFVLNSKQVMKLSLIMGGLSVEFRGEVAVCGEATAMVHAQGMPNMTMLCNGARMYGDYTDHEVVVGVPAYMMDKIEEKVLKLNSCGGALCGCMVSDLPRELIQNFRDIGFEKSTDYFMGKIGSRSVRIYINKDENGVLKQVTLYLPMKLNGEPPEVKPPFMTREREGWLDIYATIDTQSEGIDLYAGGEAMLKVFANLMEKSVIWRGKND
ncbi:MAG: DUF169 domain-containing protein [bacterium]